jgi:hypothetical protein
LPEIGLLPDHAPEATQEAASVDDHVSMEDPALGTDAGVAESDKPGPFDGGVVAPPQLTGD